MESAAGVGRLVQASLEIGGIDVIEFTFAREVVFCAEVLVFGLVVFMSGGVLVVAD